MAVSNAAYYGLRVYSRYMDPLSYDSPSKVASGGLGRLFCILSTPMGFIRRFGISAAVRDGCCAAGYAKALFDLMSCVV